MQDESGLPASQVGRPNEQTVTLRVDTDQGVRVTNWRSVSYDTGEARFVLSGGQETFEYTLPDSSPSILFRGKASGTVTVSVMGLYDQAIATVQVGAQCHVTILAG